MSNSALSQKSLDFAVRVVNFYKFLCERKNEYVSRLHLRPGLWHLVRMNVQLVMAVSMASFGAILASFFSSRSFRLIPKA